MRARWSALSLNRDSDWRFTSAQAARMRAAVAARAAEPLVTTLARR
jgi:hypothetical protein